MTESAVAQPVTMGGKACTPPTHKTVNGQIVFLDIPAHKIVLKDREGTSHTFLWTQKDNEEFSKLRKWWFRSIIGEHEPDINTWRVLEMSYLERPADWPTPPYSKENGAVGKLDVLQTCLKVAGDVWIMTHKDLKTPGYPAAMQEILAETEKAAAAVMRAGGAP